MAGEWIWGGGSLGLRSKIGCAKWQQPCRSHNQLSFSDILGIILETWVISPVDLS